jgi:CRP-like cAMP-binding protein
VTAPVDVLRSVSLFESLSDDDVQRLAEALRERVFSEGDVILSEGKGGVGFYVIGDGAVTYTVEGKEVGMGGPGDYFGEVALISDRPRSATVTAATDVTVYGMTLWEFRALVEENPAVASELLQVMADRQAAQS